MRTPACCRWLWSLLVLSLSGPPLFAQETARPMEAPTINLRRTVTVDVVRKTKDAVVYISTTKIISRSVSPFANNPFFRQFDFPQEVVRVPANSLGSGFIVHPEGYVVTNNHVIDRAREISVEFADGRKLAAELISADPDADLAILKVSTDKPLPTLQLGDSSDLMIGEPVIAVGNPLGYSHSVSTGIVSAIHRDLKGNDDKILLPDLIQTDAAINPGNSGGPLLNAYGQVIGINTAIRGDAQNIGFAIQVNKLRDMVPALLNPSHARKLEIPLHLSERRTVSEPAKVTAEVEWTDADGKKQPVAQINGVTPNDIIDAYAIILKTKSGGDVVVKLADGSERKLTAKPVAPSEAIVLARSRLGITVEEVTPRLAQKLSLFDDAGILVTEVLRDSIAEQVGLQPGDVIIKLGIYPISSLNDFGLLLQQMPDRGRVPIQIRRGDATLVGALNLRRSAA